MSQPFPMPNHPRATIDIAHSIDNDHAITVSYDGVGEHTQHGRPDRWCRADALQRAELNKSTGRLFDKALEQIEHKLKAVLTAATKTRIKLLTRVDSVSDRLTSATVDCIAEQYQHDSHNAITISEEQAGVIGQIADAWYWDSLGTVLEANDLLGLMLTGRDAGIAANLADFTETGLIYPLKRVTHV